MDDSLARARARLSLAEAALEEQRNLAQKAASKALSHASYRDACEASLAFDLYGDCLIRVQEAQLCVENLSK